jgi:hypothetical protein
MPNITMHLTANFYPPIPADIQIACQTFFDQIVEDAMPWQIMDKYGNIIDQDIADYDVLDRTLILPNGAEITARGMLDELRLWEALFWDCEPEMIDEDHELQYSESKELAGQLSFWENE